jgi:hypothetical protein
VRFLRFASLFFLLPFSGCAAHHASLAPPLTPIAEKIRIPGVSDAGKVNDFLYRGSQPHDQALGQLKSLGIDTIVDLRGEFPGTMEKERVHAESLGIQLLSLPGNGWSPPKDEDMARFLSLFQGTSPHHVYIHCWLGGDRSGVFIAAYRIAFDGWTPEQALAEMRAFHFKGFFHPAMKTYIRDFPARLQRSTELAPFRNEPSARRQNKPSCGQPSCGR